VPHIFTTEKPGGTFGNTGVITYAKPAIDGLLAADMITGAIPTGIIPMKKKPSFAVYNGAATSRCYMVGGWSDNLVITENFHIRRQPKPAGHGQMKVALTKISIRMTPIYLKFPL